jgi:hypothetical protein
MGLELQRSEITLIFYAAPPELLENVFRFSINKMLLWSIIQKSIFYFKLITPSSLLPKILSEDIFYTASGKASCS